MQNLSGGTRFKCYPGPFSSVSYIHLFVAPFSDIFFCVFLSHRSFRFRCLSRAARLEIQGFSEKYYLALARLEIFSKSRLRLNLGYGKSRLTFADKTPGQGKRKAATPEKLKYLSPLKGGLKPGSTIGYRSSRQGMFLAPPTSACTHQPGKDHSGYSFPDCADQ